MYPGMADFLAAQYVGKHLRDAQQERRACPARPRATLRARLAERLHALAARIDVPAHLESEPATA
jgi:hypothetical protein